MSFLTLHDLESYRIIYNVLKLIKNILNVRCLYPLQQENLLVYVVEIVVGFAESSYVVREYEGEQQVCAELISGILRLNLAIQFSTNDGDASGKFMLDEFAVLLIGSHIQHRKTMFL